MKSGIDIDDIEQGGSGARSRAVGAAQLLRSSRASLCAGQMLDGGSAARLPPPLCQLALPELAANERHAIPCASAASLLPPSSHLQRFGSAGLRQADRIHLAWTGAWTGFTDNEQAVVLISGLVLGLALHAGTNEMLLLPFPMAGVRWVLDRCQSLMSRTHA